MTVASTGTTISLHTRPGVVVAEQVQLLERTIAGIDVDEHERVLRTLDRG